MPKLAREVGGNPPARTDLPWSHVVTLLFAQLTHRLGLNDVCDALHLHAGLLSAMRGATPPSRNNLSHANRTRDPAKAEQLFWRLRDHLQKPCPQFGRGRRRRFTFRFKRMIHLVDSTPIRLVAHCTGPLPQVGVNLPADLNHPGMSAELRGDLVEFCGGLGKRVKLAPALGGFEMRAVGCFKRLDQDGPR